MKKISILMAILLILSIFPAASAIAEEDYTSRPMGCLIPDYDIEKVCPEHKGEVSYSAVALPATVDNSQSPYFPGIGDQGWQGSCASFSSTYYAATYTRCKALGVTPNANNTLSPAFIYPLLNGGGDNGSYIMDNVMMLCRAGAPSINTMPYNSTSNVTDADITQWPTQASVWEEGIDNKLKNFTYYYYGNGAAPNIEGIKTLLANGDLVLFQTLIGSILNTSGCVNTVSDNPNTALDNAYTGESIISYQASTGLTGSHAITFVGYNDYIWNDINGNGTMESAELGAFLIANSWGSSWKNDGFIWVSYDAFNSTSSLRPTSSYTNPFLSYSYVFTLEAYTSTYTPTALCEVNITASDRYAMSVNAELYNASTDVIPSLYATALSYDYGQDLNMNPDPTPFAGKGAGSTGTMVLDVSYDDTYSSPNNYTWNMRFDRHYTNPEEGTPTIRSAYQINSASLNVNSSNVAEASSNTYSLTVLDNKAISFDYINSAPYEGPSSHFSYSADPNNHVGISRFYNGATASSSTVVPDAMCVEYPVTSITSSAFNGCTSMTSVTIPLSVTQIAANAFDGCSSSLEFVVYSNSAAARFALDNGYSLSVYEDMTGDGVVDLLDVTAVASHYGTDNAGADRNSDGTVNMFDLVVVAREARDPVDYTLTLGEGTTGSFYLESDANDSYAFIPATSGTYTFQGKGSLDTYGTLKQGNTILANDDDGGQDYNFSITYSLTAGVEYTLVARGYDDSVTGFYSVDISN